MTVLGPRLLGEAINVIVYGVFTHRTRRRRLRPRRADPLVLVVALNVGAAICALFQGRLTATRVVQRSVFRLREDVQAKLSRLPLSYFDRQPRGEILSRVTNDIDNLPAVHAADAEPAGDLAADDRRRADADVHHVLGARADRAGHRARHRRSPMRRIAKRAQPQFIKQWKYTGKLNGHIEEMYTGHALVTAFGQREKAMADLHRAERGAVPGQLPGAVHLRHDPAADDVHVAT